MTDTLSKAELMEAQKPIFRSGFVSIIGRPNVGKSTLLNAIVGEKIAITTSKPQTTRNRILGIKTLPTAQIVFIDTPGIHKPRHRLGEIMVKTAFDAYKEADIILLMVKPELPGPGDRFIIDAIKQINKDVLLIINKVDLVKKSALLPVIDEYKNLYPFKEIIPISALKGNGVSIVLDKIVQYLPEGPKYYSDDLITDQIERFMVAEIIREKVMALTEEEIPHCVAVNIEEMKERRREGEERIRVVYIRANIYIEKESQKGIIIGKGGGRLKDIATAARQDIEELLGTKLFLELWVKVKGHWRKDEKTLSVLGYI